MSSGPTLGNLALACYIGAVSGGFLTNCLRKPYAKSLVKNDQPRFFWYGVTALFYPVTVPLTVLMNGAELSYEYAEQVFGVRPF